VAEQAWIRATLDVDSERAHEFIRRLAEDDDFRAELESNPEKTLTDYGVAVSPDLIPDEIRLPSKDEIRRLLTQLDELAGTLPQGLRRMLIRFFPFFFHPLLRGLREE
jgi:hypothetical protein